MPTKTKDTRKISRYLVLLGITSPFGIVKALPNDTFVMHQDSVIVWPRQIRDLASECKIKELRNSTGTISKLDYNTYKLVDRPGQLDYI
jgi:hypothetical protein